MSAARQLVAATGGRASKLARRLAPVCVAGMAFAAAVALGAPILSGESAAAVQSAAADDRYRPCREVSSIDLLVMMDGSGSLNGPDGADPGGRQRTSALQQIREKLSNEPAVRLALVSFDVDAYRHSDRFERASAQNPSNNEIGAAMGAERHTDYSVALAAALEAFDGAQADSCRVMVWFTDGLHDPEPGFSEAETAAALELQAELCRTTRQRFEDERIQTIAVLLGSSFERGLSGSNPDQRAVAEMSLNIIRAFTGHRDSPFVAGVPTAEPCRGIEERAGEIIAVTDVRDVINALIEAIVGVDPEILDWSDCDSLRDGSEVSSAELPAGVYVEEMQVFAYGGGIERYALADPAASVEPDWRQVPAGERRLSLWSEQLRGLSAGWSLKLQVLPDDGGDADSVTLRCYSRPVDAPLEMHGSILDDGGEATELQAATDYTLRVEMWPFECPVDAGDFVLVAEFPTRPVRNRGCEQGQQADFEYNSGRPEAQTRVTSFKGPLTPRYAENLWGRDSEFEAVVMVDFIIFPPPPTVGEPTLDCDTEPRLDGEWLANEFSGRVVAATCRVQPPGDGVASDGAGTVGIEVPSGDLPYHLETPQGTRITGPLELDSNDLPQEFHVVSEDLSSQGPWETDSEVEVTLNWRMSDESDVESVEVVYVPPSDPGSDMDPTDIYPDRPNFGCSDRALEILGPHDGEVPEEPLRATAACTASGPRMGELRLALDWSDNPADDASGARLPESFDWLFGSGPGGAGAGRTLILRADEELTTLDFVTPEPLDNARIQGAGTVTVTAVWLLPWGEQREIAREDLRFEIDLRARSNPWLAALIALVAAVLTYTLLYGIMAFKNRLPAPGMFFGHRLEFTTERRPSGLRSAQLEGFLLDEADLSTVTGGPRQLRVSNLRINAEHPRWREVTRILDGGWGEPHLQRGQPVFGATLPGPRSTHGTTAGCFTELAVVALETDGGGRSEAPAGFAYLLVPKRDADRSLDSRVLTDLLRGMTTRYEGLASESGASDDSSPGEEGARSRGTPPDGVPPSGPPDELPPRRPPSPPRPRPETGSEPPARRREPPPRRPRRPEGRA